MEEFSLINKHSWLVSNWGPCLSGLIWQQQIVFMATPRPSIRPATEDLVDSSRGSHCRHGDRLWKQPYKRYRVLAWNKEKEKDGERGTGEARVSCVLFRQNQAPAWVRQHWAESTPLSAERVHPVQHNKSHTDTWVSLKRHWIINQILHSYCCALLIW